MSDLLTIGISCYNIEDYIARAIASVCAQTYDNLEIIVVDDASTDNSGAICDEWAARDARIRVIHQENTGLGGTRNRVIEEAKGAYIAFLDGDDYVERTMYETLYNACVNTKAPLAVCRYAEEREKVGDNGDGSVLSPCETGDKQNRPQLSPGESEGTGTLTHFQGKRVSVPVPLTHTLSRDEALQRYIEEDEEIPIQNAAWNKLYKKELIAPFRYPEHKLYEDMVVTTKIIAASDKVAFVDTPLYHYIIDRGGSIMNRGVNPRIISDQIPAYREKSAFLQSIGKHHLADTHDYLVLKKLLVLYTETFRQADGEQLRKALKEEMATYQNRTERIYNCNIADPHQTLRMKLFFLHPALYNAFTAINNGVLHRIRGIA